MSIFGPPVSDDDRAKVESVFFQDSPIEIEHNCEGMKVRREVVNHRGSQYNKRTMILGYRSGPSYNVQALIHEMAHLVEIDDRRILAFGWGLKVPEVVIFGRTCLEPVTMQATDRELRVIAYQANVQEHLGFGSVDFTVKSLEYMPDYMFVPGKCDKERHEFRMARMEEYRKIYTLDRFMNEWERKSSLLRKRQFTRCKDYV